MKNFQRIILVICLLLFPFAISVSVKALQGTSKHNKQFKAPAQPVKSIQPQIPAAPQKIAKKNLPKKTATEDSKGKPPIRKDIDYMSYMQDLQRCIQTRWRPSSPPSDLNRVTVSFQVLRDGSLVKDSVKITSSTATKDAEQAALNVINDGSSTCFRLLPEGAAERVTINFTFTRSAHPSH